MKVQFWAAGRHKPMTLGGANEAATTLNATKGNAHAVE